ncbi:hypothetical protein CPC08DRAFT_769806 [Agrocybe pediades]|nr:hypothetical protein CPC08DRAFT_769806 [Agrocybe pediades]
MSLQDTTPMMPGTDTVPGIAGISDSEANRRRFYAVVRGLEPGVYEDPARVQSMVTGVPGAYPVKFNTREEAEAAYQVALHKGEVARITVVHERLVLTLANVHEIPGLLPNSCTPAEDGGKYYAVTVGRTPGVFSAAAGIHANLLGISGHRCVKYDTEEEARADVVGALYSGHLVKVVREVHVETLRP